jgi:hypothetical protein
MKQNHPIRPLSPSTRTFPRSPVAWENPQTRRTRSEAGGIRISNVRPTGRSRNGSATRSKKLTKSGLRRLEWQNQENEFAKRAWVHSKCKRSRATYARRWDHFQGGAARVLHDSGAGLLDSLANRVWISRAFRKTQRLRSSGDWDSGQLCV